jgi:DNA-directed RNA polymerase subunit beta'
VYVEDGQLVDSGHLLFDWDPYSDSILASRDGTAHFVDIKEDSTFNEIVDEATGMKHKQIIESRDRRSNPHILLVDDEGTKLANHILPIGAHLLVEDGERVKVGMPLAKMPRKSQSIRDITGGLPRVTELFEARRPKDPAIVAEIDGVVRFGGLKRGVRMITVSSEDGQVERKYAIPYGKHILVHDHDRVSAGEKLTEGSVLPHDILAIQGPGRVQEYLAKEIQEVYRSQGVSINDKHIEVIVRQMLQKVRIEEPGDTRYLEGDQVDRIRFMHDNEEIVNRVVVEERGDTLWSEGTMIEKTDFNRANRKLKSEGKLDGKARQAQPAVSTPILLGITQASLSTNSFISAASFQETTRVLTDAAIANKVDKLSGLKENVIMGHLIPAGTGLIRYAKLHVDRPEPETEELAQDFKIEMPDSIEEAMTAGMGGTSTPETRPPISEQIPRPKTDTLSD